jgi:FKBP-type peptidyl-prolyl cis-trans isomerase SlyD
MADQTIADGTVVGIVYELRVDGETVDEAAADEPLEYLHGADNIVPGLEAALAGHQVGDHLRVTVSPADGYGEYDPDDVEWFPRQDFDDAPDLTPGTLLTLEDEDGELYDVIVSEVTSDEVALDFNSPLAGKTLDFAVEVVTIRPAEPDELAQGCPYGTEEDFE